jgi:hypothetical protein
LTRLKLATILEQVYTKRWYIGYTFYKLGGHESTKTEVRISNDLQKKNGNKEKSGKPVEVKSTFCGILES